MNYLAFFLNLINVIVTANNFFSISTLKSVTVEVTLNLVEEIRDSIECMIASQIAFRTVGYAFVK